MKLARYRKRVEVGVVLSITARRAEAFRRKSDSGNTKGGWKERERDGGAEFCCKFDCARGANERRAREPRGLHRHPAERIAGDLIGSAKRCSSWLRVALRSAGGVDPDLRESPGEITAPARKARDVGTQVGASRAFARMYAR